MSFPCQTNPKSVCKHHGQHYAGAGCLVTCRAPSTKFINFGMTLSGKMDTTVVSQKYVLRIYGTERETVPLRTIFPPCSKLVNYFLL